MTTSNIIVDAVSDTEYERSLVIAERAGVDPRTAGQRLHALAHQGLVVKKWTQKHGGVWLYRRSKLAPSNATKLVGVNPDHKRVHRGRRAR